MAQKGFRRLRNPAQAGGAVLGTGFPEHETRKFWHSERAGSRRKAGLSKGFERVAVHYGTGLRVGREIWRSNPGRMAQEAG